MIPETVEQEKNINAFRIYKQHFGTDNIMLPSLTMPVSEINDDSNFDLPFRNRQRIRKTLNS